MKKILGFGAALVDLLAHVDEEWIRLADVPKGGMNLVDDATLRKLLSRVENPVVVPGGSACNTMVGVAKLSGKASFVSKVGNDDFGRLFARHLENSGVENRMATSSVSTGTVLSAVTPDAERTMFTFLGASNEFSASDISPDLFDDVGILYLEGYRAYNGECFSKAVRMAKRFGAKTALDFGSFGVVNDCRPLFDELFSERKIDIVIANEEEAKAYTGVSEEAALEKLSRISPVAVVKLGARGALIASDGVVSHVEAGKAKAVDTTGAGDLWAAGFLYGILSGLSMERSGVLGSLVANEVVQVVGAQIPESGWERIRGEVDSVLAR